MSNFALSIIVIMSITILMNFSHRNLKLDENFKFSTTSSTALQCIFHLLQSCLFYSTQSNQSSAWGYNSVHERVDMSMTGKFFVLKNKVSHSSFQLVRWFITFFKGKRVKFFMLPTASHAFTSFHKWSNKVSREWVYMHEIKKAENFLLSGSHYDENENEVKNELWNKLPSEINWKLAVLRAMEMIFFPLVHDAPLSSPCLSHPIISST